MKKIFCGQLQLSKEPKEYQCGAFLACKGEDAQKVYDGLHFTEAEDQNDNEIVMQRLETFCIERTDVRQGHSDMPCS